MPKRPSSAGFRGGRGPQRRARDHEAHLGLL